MNHIFTPQDIPAASQEAWNKAAGEEVGFWDWWLQHKGHCGFMADDYLQRLDPTSHLQDIVAQRLRGPSKILDVGAGPLTWLGKSCPHPVSITPTDALAARYMDLLAKYKVTPLVQTLQIPGERLAFELPLNSFDVVFARNCLDHSACPAYIIDQMVACCKPGGWVGLEHHFAEGTRLGTGLHQWDFLLYPDMHCVVERPGGDDAVDLNYKYRGILDIQTQVREMPGYQCWCSCWGQKLVATS